MKQLQKNDNIKLRISLISKLNNRERINMNNLLLGVEFNQQQNDFLKFMLEVESLNGPESTLEETKNVERRVREKLSAPLKDAEEEYNVRSLLVKVWAIRLMKEIVRQPVYTLESSVKKIASQLSKLEELRLMNRIMFNLSSLLNVGFQDIGKITQSHYSAKQNNSLRQMVGLIKLIVKPQEGREILEKADLGEGVSVDKFIKERQTLQVVLKALIGREKELLKNQKEIDSDERSKYLLSQSDKKIIRNIIEGDFKINLDDPRKKVYEDINKLSQSSYLLASSIVNLYYETKPQVLAKLRETQFFKYLITSKSVLVQNFDTRLSRISRISKGSRVQKTKRNPKLYENFIQNSNTENEQVHMPKCKDGEYFLKFNFGNSKSSRKFVQITEETIRWSAKKEEIRSGTKEKMDEVVGVVYGKITQRHQQNQTIEPQFCFSILLKGRTLDLAIQKKQDLEPMFSFIRGAITIINEHHQHEKTKLEKKFEQLKEGKKAEREELQEEMKSCQNKVQSINKGKLLWKNLFLTLGSRVKMSDDADSYQRKAKGISQLVSKIPSSPSKSVIK